jgi:hypothetical protein
MRNEVSFRIHLVFVCFFFFCAVGSSEVLGQCLNTTDRSINILICTRSMVLSSGEQ